MMTEEGSQRMRGRAEVIFWIAAIAIGIVIVLVGGKWLAAQF
jgi:hypothetical protein